MFYFDVVGPKGNGDRRVIVYLPDGDIANVTFEWYGQSGLFNKKTFPSSVTRIDLTKSRYSYLPPNPPEGANCYLTDKKRFVFA
ncbi:MAG: hypothetical protein JW716_02575 [Candidatus Aenigmarchaeota archaeon]|nr:hypothetical protein [Candidatus Aenigmarchaeota archaeon]